MSAIVFVLLAMTAAVGVTQSPSLEFEEGELGRTAFVPMRNTPYPHASRAEGFKSGDKSYPVDPHYLDNTVAIFIPRSFKAGEQVDLLIYFHGHYNNVRKALDEFKLREQIVASGRNVILVFPEGPKDVPDSGGGRLEEPGALKLLVDEVLEVLFTSQVLPHKQLGRVLLAGHSGAYRVISFCVEHGGLDENISDVCLLDATYDRLDAFADWLKRRPAGRLFSIFTDHLAADNVYLMTRLHRDGTPYTLLADKDANDETVAGTRVLLLHTRQLSHNQTVQWLQRWLRGVKLPNQGQPTRATR